MKREHEASTLQDAQQVHARTCECIYAPDKFMLHYLKGVRPPPNTPAYRPAANSEPSVVLTEECDSDLLALLYHALVAHYYVVAM